MKRPLDGRPFPSHVNTTATVSPHRAPVGRLSLPFLFASFFFVVAVVVSLGETRDGWTQREWLAAFEDGPVVVVVVVVVAVVVAFSRRPSFSRFATVCNVWPQPEKERERSKKNGAETRSPTTTTATATTTTTAAAAAAAAADRKSKRERNKKQERSGQKEKAKRKSKKKKKRKCRPAGAIYLDSVPIGSAAILRARPAIGRTPANGRAGNPVQPTGPPQPAQPDAFLTKKKQQQTNEKKRKT